MDEIERLTKRLARELRARREAEQLLETKSRELFDANLRLSQLTLDLEMQVRTRTRELLAAQRVGRVGTFVKNLRSGQADWSEWVFRLYGLDPASGAEGMLEAARRIHPDDLASTRLRLEQAIRGELEPGREQRSEYRIIRPDGSVVWLRAHWEVSQGGSGSDPLLTGTVQDITEQKAAEAEIEKSRRLAEGRVAELERAREALATARDEAEESNRSKSRFLAIMSHEIRTPLNGVLGALQLLGDSQLDDGQRRLLQLALSSADGLRTVTNDVIDLSRLEARRLELEIVPFDIQDLLGEICEFWRPLAMSKGLALGLTTERDLPRRVRGDPARLRQILNNFMSNAIKFTEHGRVDVWLGRDDADTPDAPDQARFRIDVQDTGVGITRADQRRLFEDFTQLSQPGAGERPGAGLGLAICRELSRLMKGVVGLSSAPDAGSTFWFRFPMQVDASPAVATAPRPEAFTTLSNLAGQALRVLVAEDVPTNQIIVQMMLKGFGCRVDLVGNGVEAANAVAHGDYDIVLMDVAMPEMDGIEATRRIRAMENERATIPIVGLTAFALPEEQQRFQEAGMDLVLNKPLQRAALHDALVSALAPHRAQPALAVPKSPDASELDTRVLVEMTEGLSAPQLGELLGRVVEDIGTHAATALACVRSGDAEGLARSCHALKGLASSFGNRELTAVARRIERHCREGNAEAAMAAALGDLHRVCRAAQAALGNYVNGMKVTADARGA